jgi:hypothetical protein
MTYSDGSTVTLGDVVRVPVRGGKTRARVVMLGDTYEHLDINERFLEWVKGDQVLRKSDVVVEWLGDNPFAHEDPRYAPVGNYMFTVVDECVERDA